MTSNLTMVRRKDSFGEIFPSRTLKSPLQNGFKSFFSERSKQEVISRYIFIVLSYGRLSLEIKTALT